MAHLFNRNVLLGICGGIAAYKSAQLVRDLQALGASVRVIMTRGAEAFITPLTLQALSGHPVHTQLLDAEAERGMGHIELARWADLLLVAPATADLLARLAAGRADDLLSTVALATAAPCLLAPAMNQQMWRDTATVANVHTLRERGYTMIGPAAGEQACGDVGPGRMSEPADIAACAASLFDTGALSGRRVVITAGPTREPLDPVRFISNHSSGKMGFALAQAAVDAGALTTLIAGPVQLATPPHVERIDVETAQQMLDAALQQRDGCDIFIGCAAVADYRPAELAPQKMKKQGDTLQLTMVRNPDIIATIASAERPPFTVGFAAETEALQAHALAKLKHKRLQMIIANAVGGHDTGFNSDDNTVSVYWQDGAQHFETLSKTVLARALMELIARQFHAHTQTGTAQVGS